MHGGHVAGEVRPWFPPETAGREGEPGNRKEEPLQLVQRVVVVSVSHGWHTTLGMNFRWGSVRGGGGRVPTGLVSDTGQESRSAGIFTTRKRL